MARPEHYPQPQTRSLLKQVATIVPQRCTPDKCRKMGCDIAMIHTGRHSFVTHEANSLYIPHEHMIDDTVDIWSVDVYPWLETQHEQKASKDS